MQRSIVLLAVLLAACGGTGSAERPAAENGAASAGDTALEGTPRAGAIRAVQQRAGQAEADMAERARQAEEQVRAAEGGTPRP